MLWLVMAVLSAIFAGLTAVLAKCGIKKTDSDIATALRTIVVLIFSWIMVFIVGSADTIMQIDDKSLLFLILSGAATGASWVCYFKALSVGDVNKVVSVDKSSTILSVLLAIILFGETNNLPVKLSFALMDGDKMSGIAYVIENYGIIYNKGLLKKAGYSAKDITNFESFKKVVEDITARKDELGFSAFTSAGMDGSSDWRFKTHLANLPIYYEYKDEGINSTEAIKGTYLDNYRQIWDLYINNATCKSTEISTKTADDATAEFVTEEAVFYQNGTWEYNNVVDLGDENLGMLPIYIGVEGEEEQGVCTGTENYWCVNSKASEEDIQATLDFMNWCVTSETGVESMCKDMGFVIPFNANLESENVLVNEANKYLDEGKTPVSWNFSTMPSEEWKNGVGSALTAYAADQTDANWDKVVTAFVDGWATEAAAAK